MKRIAAIIVLSLLVLSSCSLIGPDPQVRFADPDQWYVEMAAGTKSGSMFTREISHVFLTDFSTTAYVSLKPGTWDLAYKGQIAGSTEWSDWFVVSNGNFVKGKKYTLTFSSDGMIGGGSIALKED